MKEKPKVLFELTPQGMGMGVNTVMIQLGDECLHLDAGQWKEVMATLDGKREVAMSSEMEGYAPKMVLHYNKDNDTVSKT